MFYGIPKELLRGIEKKGRLKKSPDSMFEDSLEESSKGFLKELLKELRIQSLEEISESKWNLKVFLKNILNESQKKKSKQIMFDK